MDIVLQQSLQCEANRHDDSSHFGNEDAVNMSSKEQLQTVKACIHGVIHITVADSIACLSQFLIGSSGHCELCLST